MSQDEIDTRHKIFTELYNKFREQETALIRKALTEQLGRVPTQADAKITQRIFVATDNNRYTLKYNDRVLGHITYDFPDLSKGEREYTITFKPLQ